MERGICELGKVRIRGPLAPFAPLVAAEARKYGYTALTTANVLRLTANLSRWMEARGLGPRDLSREAAREFTTARRAAGRRSGRSLRSLGPVLTALAGAGALAADPPAGPGSEKERLLAAFGHHLRCERALAAGDRGGLCRPGPPFPGRAGRQRLDGLDRRGRHRARCSPRPQQVSPGSAQYFVAALRAFLRFCFLEGLTGTDLAGAALAVTGRRRSPLPQGISRAEARGRCWLAATGAARGPAGLRGAGDAAAAGPARQRGRGAEAR